MADVLLIDDDENVRLAMGDILTAAGNTVYRAANLDQARELLDQKRIDVAVVDIMLGEESGLDLLDQIQRVQPGVEVIIITGSPSASNLYRSMAEGIFVYLVKPVSSREICEAVQSAMKKRRVS